MWVLTLSSREVLRQRDCSSGPHRGQNDLEEALAHFGQGADLTGPCELFFSRHLPRMKQGSPKKPPSHRVSITDHFLWCLASLLQIQEDPRPNLSWAPSLHIPTLGLGSHHVTVIYLTLPVLGQVLVQGFLPVPGGLPVNPLVSAWGQLVSVPHGSVHSMLLLLVLPQSAFNQTAHTSPTLLKSLRWERCRLVVPAQGWSEKCDLESPISEDGEMPQWVGRGTCHHA